MTTSPEIRPLRAEDRAAWDELWAGYLRFYRHELSAEVTDATFARLCEGREGMFGLVAVLDGAVVGFANALVHASTWSTGGYCYLEDLFVAPTARGTGAGERLIAALEVAARERGCDRLHWQTEQFNAPARKLYDSVAQLTSYVVYERDLSR